MLRELCAWTTSLLKLYIILRQFASKIFNLREDIVFTPAFRENASPASRFSENVILSLV